MSMISRKQQRQQSLQAALDDNPFLTDEQLAQQLEASVPTIRLDRLALGIPELKGKNQTYGS